MNKKGGAMVEAVLVFPVITLSLMTIIAIMMFLFEEAAVQAELHLVLRTATGRETGTFQGNPGSSNVSVDRDFKGIHRVMYGKSSVTFEGAGILPRPYQKPVTGYQYLTDERKYVRYFDFFTREGENDGAETEKTCQ